MVPAISTLVLLWSTVLNSADLVRFLLRIILVGTDLVYPEPRVVFLPARFTKEVVQVLTDVKDTLHRSTTEDTCRNLSFPVHCL
ncbi:hypothetical protein BU25DRAFT_221792 [Macroventuria anomochaeta]|uniref:Uncharacterized protein n=1 Tax=Macroventuria anomochaeta TaxID=301207 RepID=A0ACB6SBK6_9PLEO|nr:uncharacterized protein BU25DRAFT_221792 [Macroventuria anomochaeta]KAF2630985.1 hypothetical protein BU25DRAFT_221792 [Macroventuria anomochaeta]